MYIHFSGTSRWLFFNFQLWQTHKLNCFDCQLICNTNVYLRISLWKKTLQFLTLCVMIALYNGTDYERISIRRKTVTIIRQIITQRTCMKYYQRSPGVLLNFLFNLYFQSNSNEKQKNLSRNLFDDPVKHSSCWVFWIVLR